MQATTGPSVQRKERVHARRRISPLVLVLSLPLLVGSLCKKPPDEVILEPVNVSNDSGRSEQPACAVDSRGTVHLVWTNEIGGNEGIVYAYKPTNGEWSVPVNISSNNQGSRFPSIAVGPDDKLHLAWQDASPYGHPGPVWRIFYSERAVGGDWTTPETIAGERDYVVPKLAVDGDGSVHMVWLYGGWYEGIRYRCRTSAGVWLPDETVVPYPAVLDHPAIAVDGSRSVHLTVGEAIDTAYNTDILYFTKPKSGAWSAPLDISSPRNGLHGWVGADGLGNVHCVWMDWTPPSYATWAVYRMRRPGGTWTETVRPCTLNCTALHSVGAIGPGNELMLPGSDTVRNHELRFSGHLLFVIKRPDSAFGDTTLVGMVNPLGSYKALAWGQNGDVHVIMEQQGEGSVDNTDIYWLGCRPKR